MPPRPPASDLDENFEADEYEWAEFNLPPVLRCVDADDEPLPHWTIDPDHD